MADIESTIAEFQNADIYSEEFLHDLESGLRKSSYEQQSES